MTDDQVKHMVDRFLRWQLPTNFNPDDGISFEPVSNKGTAHEYRHAPTGTNLFDAGQTEAMVRHMVEGMPLGSTAEQNPIPMILTCPVCGDRHIDEGEFAAKPHHTHACQGCGLVWRPAKGFTVGVQFLPGYKNQ